ncbi:MAG: hypothetical protein NVS3B25_18990 [Hymenobacter sp.]
MKNYRFYLEYETPADKRKGTVKAPGKHLGNVVAIDTEIRLEGFSGVYNWPDSAVNWGTVSAGYLRDNCRRIPETLARQIHPNLFVRLDSAE